MDNLNLSIQKLRFNSFFLFWLPVIALLGTLFVHNFFIEFKYSPGTYKFNNTNVKEVFCNEENNYCHNLDLLIPNLNKKNLDLCEKNDYYVQIIDWSEGKAGNSELRNFSFEVIFELKKNYKYIFKKSNIEAEKCIKNAKYYSLYKIFPEIFNLVYKLKNDKKYSLATTHAVYPFLFGETSISNIAKRFPVNYIFKSLLIISSIFMLIYWYSYNKIYNLLTSNNKNNEFLILGYLSGIFLFLHVIFLGSENQSEIFKSMRRLIIVSFILCEILAQFFLIKKIYPIKKNILNYISKFFLYLKVFLVGFILLATVIIITILIFYDLPNNFDYFLEWNYFLILLFFYLLTFFMWKKKVK